MSEKIRKPWFPSNGSDGQYIQVRFCDNCENDRNEDCQIIAKALFHTSPGDKIKEWTALDCCGRGFECSGFTQRVKKTG